MEVVITKTYTVNMGTLQEDDEIDVKFRIEANMNFFPGNYSGRYEDCYPDDSDLEITGVEIVGEFDQRFTEEQIIAALEDQSLDVIEDDLWDKYNTMSPEADFPEPDYDFDY
jgi:hypothetical protein